MVKMVSYLPRPETTAARSGMLSVRTGHKALLIAEAEGDKRPWCYHADQLRGLVKRHERRLQYIADDLKAEARPASKALREHLRTICYRQRCRLDSEIRRMSAMVVKYARRRKLAQIGFRDEDRRYMPTFPWDMLRRYLAEACDREGISYSLASGAAMNGGGHSENDVNGIAEES
jgi:hypothetical protein